MKKNLKKYCDFGNLLSVKQTIRPGVKITPEVN